MQSNFSSLPLPTRRRIEWLEKNGPCMECGSSEKLEVHHLNPADKTSHRVWSWCDLKRNAELEKCGVMCRKCHRKVSGEQARERNKKPLRHGTYTGFSHYGCRCQKCTDAHNEGLEWQKHPFKWTDGKLVKLPRPACFSRKGIAA